MSAIVSRLPGSIPNLLSVARLALAPAGVLFVLDHQFQAAFWVLVVAGLSDAADGIAARLLRARTRLGEVLDPIADKALLVGMIVALGVVDGLPVWLVWLVVVRDGIILAGAGYLTARGGAGRDLEPSLIGKISTFLQIALAGVVLAKLGFGWPLDMLVTSLIWTTAAAAMISGFGYVRRGWRQIAAGPRG